MQRVEGPQTPFEVYCYQCEVTFPAEARRCLHCGNRLGLRSESPSPDASPLLDMAGEEEVEDGSGSMMRRFGGLAVWALLALSALLSNMCRGGA